MEAILLTKIGLELITELPGLVSDLEADIAAIKAANGGEEKLVAALNALAQVSETIAKALA